jgi:hypothetical protein
VAGSANMTVGNPTAADAVKAQISPTFLKSHTRFTGNPLRNNLLQMTSAL